MTAVSCFTLWCYWKSLDFMVFASPSQLEWRLLLALPSVSSSAQWKSSALFSMLPACSEPLTDLIASCWTLASFSKSGLPGLQVAKLSLYFPVVHHQDQEGQGKSVHQSIYLHITQLLFHLVCREPHTVGLGIYCHSQVASSRSAPQSAISCSVPMSLAQRSALIPPGHCEVSVGMIFSFLKFFCIEALPLTVPLPTPGSVLWATLLRGPAVSCHGWSHWRILPYYWPASGSTFAMSWSNHWLLPLELGCWGDFQPSELFIHPTLVSSPTKQECWRTGVKSIYKLKWIISCYSSVVYIQLFHMTDRLVLHVNPRCSWWSSGLSYAWKQTPRGYVPKTFQHLR